MSTRQCPSCGDLTCSFSCSKCLGMPETHELNPPKQMTARFEDHGLYYEIVKEKTTAPVTSDDLDALLVRLRMLNLAIGEEATFLVEARHFGEVRQRTFKRIR